MVRDVLRAKDHPDDAGRQLSAQWLRAIRHARQCMGVVFRLVRRFLRECEKPRPCGTGFWLVPCSARRQLVLQSRVLPVCDPLRGPARLPVPLHRVSCCRGLRITLCSLFFYTLPFLPSASEASRRAGALECGDEARRADLAAFACRPGLRQFQACDKRDNYMEPRSLGEVLSLPKGEVLSLPKGEVLSLPKGEVLGLPKGEVLGLPKGQVHPRPMRFVRLVELPLLPSKSGEVALLRRTRRRTPRGKPLPRLSPLLRRRRRRRSPGPFGPVIHFAGGRTLFSLRLAPGRWHVSGHSRFGVPCFRGLLRKHVPSTFRVCCGLVSPGSNLGHASGRSIRKHGTPRRG